MKVNIYNVPTFYSLNITTSLSYIYHIDNIKIYVVTLYNNSVSVLHVIHIPEHIFITN